MITDDVIHQPNPSGFASATPRPPRGTRRRPRDPPEALARTVRDYNEAAARGDDPAFHKRAPFLQPIGVPPASGIGAIDLRVDHGAIYATFTLGGLVTNPDGAVLDGTGAPICRPVRRGPDRRQPRRPPLCQRHKPRRRFVLRPTRRPSRQAKVQGRAFSRRTRPRLQV